MNRFFHILFAIGLLGLVACSPIPQWGGAVRGKSGQVAVNTNTSGSSAAVVVIPRRGGGVVKPPKPTLDWISPNPNSTIINVVAGKVTVQIRISSATEIQLNQIDILVDGKAPGNKADEVDLLKRPAFRDQVLTFQVPVPEGRHQVQVVLAMAGDERYMVERTMVRDEAGVQILEYTPVSSATRVSWMKPNVLLLDKNELFATKDRELEVHFNITTPESLTLDKIRLLHNQRYNAPSPKAELRGQNGNFSFRDWVTLDENVSVNEIGLRVDAAGEQALSQQLKVNFSPSRPNLYVLSVGPKLNLDYSAQDASDFARAFATQGSRAHRLFNQVKVDTLIGAQATTQAIRLAVASIKNKLRTNIIMEDDVVVLFFSTHGFLYEKELYLQANDYQSYAATKTSIPYRTDILAEIKDLPCRKLIFIDACHGGGARANATDVNAALANLREAPRGLAVFTSSSSDQQSYEDDSWRNGAFTEAILRGLLDGHADAPGFGNGNRIITLSELEQYVKKTVPALVKSTKQKNQTPVLTRNDLGDIPLFVRNE